MKDSWFNHNTDKLLLFLLVLLIGGLIFHMGHDMTRDQGSIAWAEHSFDVVLGALILILTGRIARADNQTSNGLPSEPPKTEVTDKPIGG